MKFRKIWNESGDILDTVLLLVLGLGVGVLITVVVVREQSLEWKEYQARFREIATEKLDEEALATIQYGVLQIWLPQLNRTDRCISCHMGIDMMTVEQLKGDDVPAVFRPHPNPELIDRHPFRDYGCTYCHGGQGPATTYKDAHTPNRWLEPLLYTEIGRKHGFEEAGLVPQSLLEINCNLCHRMENQTPGMELINRAKKLYAQQGCAGCHTLFGKGGTVGPDLTYEGDNSHENYDFSWRDDWDESVPKSVLAWHIQHFREPKSTSPTTTMTTSLDDPDKDARALAMLMMSWKNVPLPPEYIPRPKAGAQTIVVTEVVDTASADTARADAAEKDTAAVEADVEEPVENLAAKGKELFAGKGCGACHSLDARIVGPALRGVVSLRGAGWVKQMIVNPAGLLESDETAKALLEEYGMPMPGQGVSSSEADAIIEYLRAPD